MVALVLGQAERTREGAQHLGRWLRAPGLLETGVVVNRHTGELGDLFAAQPGGAAPGTDRKAHVGGLEGFAATTQEVGKGWAIHRSIITRKCKPKQGPTVRG